MAEAQAKEQATEDNSFDDKDLSLFLEKYNEFQDCEVLNFEEVKGGVTIEEVQCPMCCGINFPNRKCQPPCGIIICERCFFINKKTCKNLCFGCNENMGEGINEDQSILAKLKTIKKMHCPKRVCDAIGSFGTIIKHFVTCVDTTLVGKQLDQRDSITEVAGLKNIGLPDRWFDKVVFCIDHRTTYSPDIAHASYWKVTKFPVDADKMILCSQIPVPHYAYTAVARYQENEIGICVPICGDKTYTPRQHLLMAPTHTKLEYQFYSIPKNKDKTVFTRESELLLGEQICNDEMFHFRVKTRAFIENLKQQKSPYEIVMKWTENEVQPERKDTGTYTWKIPNLLVAVNQQQSAMEGECYSQYFVSYPLLFKGRAALDLSQKEMHTFIFRVVDTYEEVLAKKHWEILEVQFLKNVSTDENQEDLRELYCRRLILRGPCIAFNLSRTSFWSEEIKETKMYQITFKFRSIGQH